MKTIDYRHETIDKRKCQKLFLIKTSFVIPFCLLSIVYSLSSVSYAEDKSWNAEGDGVDWFDPANWLAIGKPQSTDNAKVDLKDASVDVGQAFEAKSLTIGGKKTSTVNVSNFVSGTLEPDSVDGEALIVRKDGKIIIKGSTGKITMKGTYKDSEEIIPEEPGFMVYVK